ncbi:hypothetical protein GCM10008967_13090 [Bacillus carboniphilus]|uniref:VOC domain-containing protein n=1 Tax=Bacillus carboniphilus TaxID=86663 RepID=A0ABN0W396_9BACI
MLNEMCVLTVKVANIKESIQFYTEVLGFEVNKHYGDCIVSLNHKEIPIVLEEAPDVELQPKQNVLPGFVSSNLDQDIEVLRSKGVKILFDEPRPCPPGRYTVIEDPTGNQIELLEFSN